MSVRTYVLLGFLGAIMLGAFVPLQPEIAVASTHGATRSYSAPWALPEGELRVTVSASGYGGFGLLQETLTEGFTFVATALDAATVKVEGQTVTFTLLGVELVTYNVAAPAAEGQYDFSGFLLDMQKQEAITAGASSVRVGPEPTATPTPTPTATPAPTATPDPTPTPSPQPTATPMPAPTAATLVATPTATAAPPVEDPRYVGLCVAADGVACVRPASGNRGLRAHAEIISAQGLGPSGCGRPRARPACGDEERGAAG